MKSCQYNKLLARVLFFALFTALVVVPVRGFAETDKWGGPELRKIVASIEARYDKLKSVSADFSQEVLAPGAKAPMLSGGRVWFKKPGMMRWVYTTGTTDELIGNREFVWLYQPDLNQVIETDAQRVSSIATDFLTGVGRLSHDFDISLLSKNDESYLLLLIPRDETTGISRLTLEVDRKELILFRTVVEDAFGTATTVTFTNIRFDEEKDDSFFRFVPSAGLNVITQ